MPQDGPNLAKDFKNFDMLWFDLSTKVRELFLELNQPLVDKVYQSTADISAINKQNADQEAQIKYLDQIVFQKEEEGENESLDIFKKIEDRIS